MKFIHCADLHLDSPLIGLDRYEGAPVNAIRLASRHAFMELIDLAIDEEVDFVLIAGDVFDGDWRDFSTGLFFNKQMARLKNHNIRVFLIRGNHDAKSKITKQLIFSDNVYELSANKPETVIDHELKIAIHGQSFKTAAVLDNLVINYHAAIKDYFNIGLLHTCLTGRANHDNYAPCVVADLQGKGYDYWALGHVHDFEVISREPWIVFSGNICGRHIKEQGARGCVLVSIEDGEIKQVEPKILPVLQWQMLTLNISDCVNYDEVLDLVHDKLAIAVKEKTTRLLIFRIVLTGESSLAAEIIKKSEVISEQIRAISFEFDNSLWIEKVILRVVAPQEDKTTSGTSEVLVDILQKHGSWKENDKIQKDLTHIWERLKRKLPAAMLSDGKMSLDNEDFRQMIMDEAKGIITSS